MFTEGLATEKVGKMFYSGQRKHHRLFEPQSHAQKRPQFARTGPSFCRKMLFDSTENLFESELLGQNINLSPNLAGKRKLRRTLQTTPSFGRLAQNTGKTRFPAKKVKILESPQYNSGSSSSLNINSWDGITDDNFEAVSTKNATVFQDVLTDFNRDFSFWRSFHEKRTGGLFMRIRPSGEFRHQGNRT